MLFSSVMIGGKRVIAASWGTPVRKMGFCVPVCLLLLTLQVATAQERSERPPAAVLWSLSLYGGGMKPMAPSDFAEFWKAGLSLSVEGDLLLWNDVVLGLTFGYARAPVNAPRFLLAKGLPADGRLPDNLDIGISQLLLSFKGIENYLLYRVGIGYEVGIGLYSMSNTQLYVIESIPGGAYSVAETSAAAGGVFAGLSLKFLLSETLQFSIKSRLHYVALPVMQHQFAELLAGLTLL